uniref:Sushi domain-containing protein n=1 Tax=Amazona collaria TaxID=241587 RepID=A0A8B9J0J2_9PSIT
MGEIIVKEGLLQELVNCGSGRVWDGNTQSPADGKKFGTKYLVEHEVHFTCDPGFQLLGSSTRTCQANGSWTGQEPRCTGTAPELSCRAALEPGTRGESWNGLGWKAP